MAEITKNAKIETYGMGALKEYLRTRKSKHVTEAINKTTIDYEA